MIYGDMLATDNEYLIKEKIMFQLFSLSGLFVMISFDYVDTNSIGTAFLLYVHHCK